MKSTVTTALRLVLAALLLVGGSIESRAWDTAPDANGLYDGLFDRPTHFPEWSQPATWPNAMFIVCDVRLGDVLGPQVPSYEIAVYDQNDELRYCNRSLPKSGNIAVLTVRGEDGVDEFHFKVLYGDDFDNPVIVDVPDVKVKFKTNQELGSPSDPLVLVLPGRTYLYETSTEPPVDKTGVDVTVFRTINAGEWSTICLPFAIPAEKLAEAFGTEVELGNFTGCETTLDGETVSHINVKFATATGIEANHPYIIKVKDKVEEISIDNVDIIALGKDEVASVDCDKQTVKVGSNTYYFYNSFIGNYTNEFLVPAKNLFLSEGKFWYSTGKTPMMAFRAYFSFIYVLPEVEQSSARISMSFDSGTTGMEGVAMVSQQTGLDGQAYDLQGRKVSGQLKKGLYIINGKKLQVR